MYSSGVPNPGSVVTVFSTTIPLSERFRKIPSHNPLRPNPNANATAVTGDDLEADEGAVAFVPRRPFRDASFLRAGANKLSSLNTVSRDLEILRLKAQLRSYQLRLNAANARKGPQNNPVKIRRNSSIFNRVGGGVTLKAGGGGKGLVFSNPSAAMQFLAAGKKQNGGGLYGISPLKISKGSGGSGGLNFFGTPKSKDDLDKELDAYMSQSKTKKKSDLDKELEEYMSARAQMSINKEAEAQVPVTEASIIAASIDDSIPDPDALEVDLDAEMELAE